MFKSIKVRLLVLFLFIALVPLSITLGWHYVRSVSYLKQQTYEHLKTVRETKRKEIEHYFKLLREQVVFFGGGNITLNAFREFSEAFKKIKMDELPLDYEDKLRTYYKKEFISNLNAIHADTFQTENLFPKNYRSVLLQTRYLMGNRTEYKRTSYDQVHDKYNNVFATFCKVNGLHDLFLVEDETGYIVYNVTKEIDFGTSLLSDAHANSNLGRLFRKVRYSGLKYSATLCDFEPYLPSNLAPAAFIAAPIFKDQKKIGTLIFQISLNTMNEITTSNKEWQEEGLGETGESYIVGNDCKMRTDSRFIIESPERFFEQISKIKHDAMDSARIRFYKTTVLFMTICNESVNKALANLSGITLTKDYRGERVLSSYAPLEVADVKWVFLAEIDEREALRPIQSFIKYFILTILAVVFTVVVAALLVAHSFTKPIFMLVNATRELGSGNLNTHVQVMSRDELGVLELSFNETVRSLKGQRTQLLDKQEEISAQADELNRINKELSIKNSELDIQKEEISTQAENLLLLNKEVSHINNNLEAMVRERTLKLEEQNKRLSEYAFTNAHVLRGPLSRIMGLINVIHLASDVDEKLLYIEMINHSCKELDEIVHVIQNMVTHKEITSDENKV